MQIVPRFDFHVPQFQVSTQYSTIRYAEIVPQFIPLRHNIFSSTPPKAQQKSCHDFAETSTSILSQISTRYMLFNLNLICE